MNYERMQTSIDACLSCARACDYCATACLNEKDLSLLARCIELDRECSEACYATAKLLGIGGEHATLFCHACAELCDTCAEECEKHADHGMEHCRRCAEACRRCADECRALVGVNA